MKITMVGLAAGFVAGGAVVPGVLLVLALGGWLPFEAISRPPDWETAIGQRALIASIDARARYVANPLSGNDAEILSAGGKLYADDCAGCHGTAKAASKWGSEDFYPRVPQFWQQRISLRPEQAYLIIQDGIRYSGMAAWRHSFSDRQLWEVADFVSRIPNQSAHWHSRIQWP